MCCKVLEIEEISKPRGQWCPECKPGTGCTVYDKRPVPCREFQCIWLQMQSKGEWQPDLRPDKCRVMFAVTADQSKFVAHVDPARPKAHEHKLVATFMKEMALKGLPTVIVVGDEKRRVVRLKEE
jgi:Fe-S-cluster containining protein